MRHCRLFQDTNRLTLAPSHLPLRLASKMLSLRCGRRPDGLPKRPPSTKHRMPPDPICPAEDLHEKAASIDAALRALFPQSPAGSNLAALFQELRLTQSKLLQQERLEALAQMAGGIAHDLNNFLTPVIGFSDFLLASSANSAGDGRRCLQGIRTAAADIVQLIDQLRQFYRPRDAYESLDSVDLNSLVHGVIDQVRPRLASAAAVGAAVQIKTELAQGLSAIDDHENDLRQAIRHLVLNAIEAMPKGGVVVVATRLEALSGDQADTGRVILEVRDTGLGMDASTQLRCLEPFFSTKGPRGHGLGLAMVYGVMRRHQGSLQIDSESGRGTTVRLLFNRAKPRATAKQAAGSARTRAPRTAAFA
jgi:signal transduction histidine kinase